MPISFLDLKVQYAQIEEELAPALEGIMANGAFIGGPEVAAFEAEFAASHRLINQSTDRTVSAFMSSWSKTATACSSF